MAQSPKNYDPILEELQQTFNNGDVDSIYSMFAIDMQQALTAEDSRSFFGQLKQGYGQISGFEYIVFEQPFHKYKMLMDDDALELNISIDLEDNINGIFIVPMAANGAKPISRNQTAMRLPMDGDLYVFWGGDTKEQNYHVEFEAQRGAFDFVMADAAQQTYRTDGKVNADYLIWGQEVLAPCSGIVYMAVDGILDNVPGEMNRSFIPGNCVFLQTDGGEFILLAHLERGSVVVKKGDRIEKGQLLGRCGNSGHSSEPHLHMHVQDSQDLMKGAGVKVYFENIMVDGELWAENSPVRGNVVSHSH